ncbi:MAG: ATP-binding protein [Pseudomonadales bacterium]|nr:ATP-binding protein [Pseudomonadales bacterium]
MTNIYPRWQKANIQEAMSTRRVLLLSGARQCGKTTLAKELIDENTEYRTLDDLTLKQAAESDPHGFVKHNKRTLIIDEVQRVPHLLPAIKKAVDEDTRPGQYLLTGSANIQALPGVQESLAGRITKLRLRPLSRGEQYRATPQFIDRVFSNTLETPQTHYDKDSLIEMACAGGFPEALLLQGRKRRRWHIDYIDAILERDLKDITKIHRLDQMQELVRILAAWSSKFMNSSQIGSSLSLQKQALNAYINALEALYLIERIKPWTHTDYDRVGKQDKLFMADSGLVASLLGWNIDRVRFDTDRSGKLIESFAFNELAALVDASDGLYELRHYRDRQKREIDFLIEREDSAMIGIEIKSGTNLKAEDFKHLKWFGETLAGDRLFTGIILYSGEHIATFGENMLAVPFGALWT